jgi:hypothetical protein
METHISSKGIQILKNLIGKRVDTITAENWKEFNRSYGNILVQTEGQFVEISNDYRLVPYFDDNEEIASFDIRALPAKEEFIPSVLEKELISETIDEVLGVVKIVRDTITLNFTNGKEDKYVIDQAIIFEMQTKEWLVSQEFIFTPIAAMYFGKNLVQNVRTKEEIIEEWKDDDGDDIPDYLVAVEREIIELK